MSWNVSTGYLLPGFSLENANEIQSPHVLLVTLLFLSRKSSFLTTIRQIVNCGLQFWRGPEIQYSQCDIWSQTASHRLDEIIHYSSVTGSVHISQDIKLSLASTDVLEKPEKPVHLSCCPKVKQLLSICHEGTQATR